MTIQLRRGLQADLPSSAPQGELLITTDTNTLYVGTGTGITSIDVGALIPTESIQNVSTSVAVGFAGATNTSIKVTSGFGVIITLPNAIGSSGQIVRMTMMDTGLGVTINPVLSQTINGDSSYDLSNQYESVSIQSDNANWIVVSTAN